MANELLSLSKLFHEKVFRIPDYQRGYAWQHNQLVDFWDDLINLQGDRYHYTGFLSLKSLNKEEIKDWGTDVWLLDAGCKAYHLVDGQQRLTTFVILINEMVATLREVKEYKGKPDNEIFLGYDNVEQIVNKYICRIRQQYKHMKTYLFGYETDNPSADYLRYKIFGEQYSGSIVETYYTRNLRYAKEFFKEKLLELYDVDGVEAINALYLKLTSRFMFNIHEIDKDYDVFVAFETMNNRGKKLTNLELLKNRLIYLTTLYDDKSFDNLAKQELRKQINDAWKEVYYQLGRNDKTPLVDDEFLKAHWSTYFTYTRRRGDDYIQFLFKEFSAKKVFEKVTDVDDDDELSEYKLKPDEIVNYVNSLKSLAKYWYDTFFPKDSVHLTKDEQLWVDKLNRIGIGYFRPLIAVIIGRRDLESEARIKAFKAIERFIFICFRLGGIQVSFYSSQCMTALRGLYYKELDLAKFVDELDNTVKQQMDLAIANFVNKISHNFSIGEGYYYWNHIKYFFYEYESSLAIKNNIDKIGSWEMFTKSEKDKVSIEHIFPQTPTKYYWKNEYRQFDEEEKKLLAGALGNLLPLSQSINSSLQNDSFADKKEGKGIRRGYENGCHAEIEISKKPSWNAIDIYQRSVALLDFMAERWGVAFSDKQKADLIAIDFVNDGRTIPPELPNDDVVKTSTDVDYSDDLSRLQLNLWENFVKYCDAKGRGDINGRKPYPQNWYEITVGANGFTLQFVWTHKKYMTLVIYNYKSEAFDRLESKKAIIEKLFGDNLDWYTSQGKEKRILFKQLFDSFSSEKQEIVFEWMIEKFDALKEALVAIGEIKS